MWIPGGKHSSYNSRCKGAAAGTEGETRTVAKDKVGYVVRRQATLVRGNPRGFAEECQGLTSHWLAVVVSVEHRLKEGKVGAGTQQGLQ